MVLYVFNISSITKPYLRIVLRTYADQTSFWSLTHVLFCEGHNIIFDEDVRHHNTPKSRARSLMGGCRRAGTHYVGGFFVKMSTAVDAAEADAVCTEDTLIVDSAATTDGMISEGTSASSGGFKFTAVSAPPPAASEPHYPYTSLSNGKNSASEAEPEACTETKPDKPQRVVLINIFHLTMD